MLTGLIPDNELRKHSSYDNKGYVFEWRGEVYRAIYKSYQDDVEALFASGLVEALVKENLFPRTEITKLSTSDSEFVIWHSMIPVVTIPSEWTFSMLKDAAKVVVLVNRISRKFGYQTIDAHGFNILFFHGSPMFIDLGSFVRIERDFKSGLVGWRPYGEFCRSFIAPLRLWSGGDSYLARKSLFGDQIPMYCFWRYRFPFVRIFPVKLLSLFEEVYFRWKALNNVPMARFLILMSVSKRRERLANRIIELDRRGVLPFLSVDLDKLATKISKIRPPKTSTTWQHYHVSSEETQRHKRILEIVSKYNIKSVLDMAGNAGFVSKLIAKADKEVRVICADYDENAVDQLYCSMKSDAQNIYPVLMNFGISVSDTKFRPVWERFQSELVMALALTHHLILRQGMTLDFILGRLRLFTSRYVLVEFMPLGLYSSVYEKEPVVPDWYTSEWFKEGFEKYFTLMLQEEVGFNRVIFLGERKAASLPAASEQLPLR